MFLWGKTIIFQNWPWRCCGLSLDFSSIGRVKNPIKNGNFRVTGLIWTSKVGDISQRNHKQ